MTTALAVNQASDRSTEALRRILKGIQEDGVTFVEVSKATDVSRTAISQLVNQGVLPSPRHVAALWSFIDRQRAAEALEPGAAPTVYKQELELWETEEYTVARGWCDYIHSKRKMGVLIGASGTGKTTILRQFQKEHPGTVYLEAMPCMRVSDLVDIISKATGISVKGSVCQRMHGLFNGLTGRRDITILVDEAEYLKKWDADKLEYLRKIWDNTRTPVILAGTPELESIIVKGTGKGNLAQLYSRKFELQLKGISVKTALTHLNQYHLTTDAAKMLAEIGADVQHGGLRNLMEILDLCLEAAAGGEIDEAMVKEATRYKLMW